MTILSNSGKMRRLKTRLCNIVKRENGLDIIEAGTLSRVISYEQLEKELSSYGEELATFLRESVNVHNISKDELYTNPYLNNVTIEDEIIGKMQYGNKRVIKRNSLALYLEDQRDLETFQIQKNYFSCDKRLKLPTLSETDKNIAYMSVEPYEITSSSEFINEASGNVLICGCGLGYTAYMISEKDNVNNITILEKNADVIELFKKQVLLRINQKDKIKIINCDAIDYINKNDLSNYDYINVDLWYDTFDMVYPYLKCIQVEEKYPNTKFSYWLESTLYTQIQKELFSYFSNNQFTQQVPQVSTVTKGIVTNSNNIINSEDLFREYISEENLKKQMITWSTANSNEVEKMGANLSHDQREFTSQITDMIKSFKKVR